MAMLVPGGENRRALQKLETHCLAWPGQPAPRYCPFQLTRRFCTLTFGRSLSPLCPALFCVVVWLSGCTRWHCDKLANSFQFQRTPDVIFLYHFSLNKKVSELLPTQGQRSWSFSKLTWMQLKVFIMMAKKAFPINDKLKYSLFLFQSMK